MKTFNLIKIDKLGDFDAKWGQRYWAECSDQLEPLMFNSLNQNITIPATITAEEVLLKQSAKGTDYHQLKKIKVVEGHPPETPPSGNSSQLDRIEDMLKELLGRQSDLRDPFDPSIEDTDELL
jgi:hypothetical protein